MSSVETEFDTAIKRFKQNLKGDTGSVYLTVYTGGQKKQFTYTELYRKAENWGQQLRQQGAVPGELVVIAMSHSDNLYASFMGAMLAGFIPSFFAPPSPKMPQHDYTDNFKKLIVISKPKIVVVDDELKKSIEPLRREFEFLNGVVSPEDLSREILSPEDFRLSPNEEDMAFLQFSSGTTGLKKGVAISHKALLWQIDHYAQSLDLAPERDRIVSWLPLYHDMGLIACYLMPLLKRIPLVAMSPFDWVRRPEMLFQAISEHRTTLAWLPNFAFNFLTDRIPEMDRQKFDLSSMRSFISCSEPVREASLQRFSKRFKSWGLSDQALGVSYAMAENTFAVTSGGIRKPLVIDAVNRDRFRSEGYAVKQEPESSQPFLYHVSSGAPLEKTQVRIVDESGAHLADRRLGEIWIQSPCLFTSYYGQPEITNKSFKNGWYMTGDLGYIADGELFVVSRKKDILIISGQNIYPEDIEEIVNGIDGVHPGRCVAFGCDNENLGTQELIVLAESKSESCKESADALRIRILQEITRKTEVTPKDVRIYPHLSLLKSSSGKISRTLNRDQYVQQRRDSLIRNSEAHVSGDDMRSRVRLIVEQVLGTYRGGVEHEIDSEESIIASGLLDSLGMVELISALEKEWQVQFSAHDLSDPRALDSIVNIEETLKKMMRSPKSYEPNPSVCITEKDIDMKRDRKDRVQAHYNFWTIFYSLIFRWKGIRFGKGMQVRGPIILRKTRGDFANISIGENVTLMPGVDLKLRDNGKIILHDDVVLDSQVRLVVANDARIEIGAGAQIGMGTIINAGADVLIGADAAIAGYCTILSSEHQLKRDVPILKQAYVYDPVYIGKNAWLAAYVYLGLGSKIGEGAIVGVQSVVSGTVPPHAVVLGNPAKIIKYRI